MSVCADLERFNIIKKNYVYLKIKKKVSYLLLSFEIFISFSLFFFFKIVYIFVDCVSLTPKAGVVIL